MVPRTIHYCWFGFNPKPTLVEKCIASWKKYCPDYEIIEWNEGNFDLTSCPLYVRQAYEARKWSFVTDYVRLKVVYEHGGIYLDTDVELKKSLDKLLNHQAFFAFETEKYINTGVGFGAVRQAAVLQEIMQDYEGIPFVLPDGTLDMTPCPNRNTPIFVRRGMLQNNQKQLLEGDILILPRDYMCPIDYETGLMKCTRNTISIHWFSAAWLTDEQRKERDERQKAVRRWLIKDRIIHGPNRILMKLLGMEKYEKLKHLIK